MRRARQTSLVALAVLCLTTLVVAQGPGRGPGRSFGPGPGGPGRGFGARHGQDERHDEDQEVFQFLLANHEKIARQVTELPTGVETLTESEDPEIADKIKEHVYWMEQRIEKADPIRMRDPLFRELFQHTDKIKVRHEETEKGVRVIETSDDPYVAKLIKAHAKTVSAFVARGFAEAMKNHPVPGRDEPIGAAATPVIEGYGAVVQLAGAAHQPRNGAKICVDMTRGGDPAELNPGIQQLAKYVNIYRGAGEQPADVKMAVVLHGDATLTILNGDAYRRHFGTKENPNFDLLHQLHEAGVEFSVCGQSLIRKGAKPDDVVVFTDTAVSALTAIVNLQADGYLYVPLPGK